MQYYFLFLIFMEFFEKYFVENKIYHLSLQQKHDYYRSFIKGCESFVTLYHNSLPEP